MSIATRGGAATAAPSSFLWASCIIAVVLSVQAAHCQGISTSSGVPIPKGLAIGGGLDPCAGAPDGSPCDDGNPCTTNVCMADICVSPLAFTQAPYPELPSSSEAATVGDFDGDGIVDIAVSTTSSSVIILRGDGSGHFAAAGPATPTSAFPVAIVSGDFNADGRLDVVTANLESGNLSVLLGNGTGGLVEAEGSPIGVGLRPVALVTADFDLDGNPDLAVANIGSNNVMVLLGDRSGRFRVSPGYTIETSFPPLRLSVADFSQDQIPDLAIVIPDADSVRIMLGDGRGSFSEGPDSPRTVGSRPQGVASGDFNQDGRSDLAVANTFSNTITVLLGDGGGRFVEAAGSPVRIGVPVIPVLVEDFNLDGHPDLVTLSPGFPSNTNLSVLLGDGSGRFTEAAGSPVSVDGYYAFSMASGDFDSDSRPDLVVPRNFTPNLAILLDAWAVKVCPAAGICRQALCDPSTGACTTASAPEAAACDDGIACSTNDACHDGACAGASVVCRPADSCHVGGSCQPETGVCSDEAAPAGTPCSDGNACTDSDSCQKGTCVSGRPVPDGSTCDDTNACTLTDTCQAGSCTGTDNVVCAALDQCHAAGTCDPVKGCSNPNAPEGTSCDDGNVCTLLETCHAGSCQNAAFAEPPGSPVAVGSGPVFIAAADFNRDGMNDLVTANAVNSVTILLASPAGSFSFLEAPGSPLSSGDYPQSIAIGDFDGNGAADMAVANIYSGTASIFLGNGDGSFEASDTSPVNVGSYPLSIASGDVNLDGWADLLVVDQEPASLQVLLGDGAGGFHDAVSWPLGEGGQGGPMIVLDLNHDRRPDAVVASGTSPTLFVLIGDGDGGFTRGPKVSMQSGVPAALASSDFNLDGTLDVVVASDSPPALTTFLGDGTGGLVEASAAPTHLRSILYSLSVADFNRDTKPDVAGVGPGVAEAVVLLGDALGGFVEASVSATGEGPTSVVASDFDRDGRPDLAVSNGAGSSVTLLTNAASLILCQTVDSCQTGACNPIDGSCTAIPAIQGTVCDDDSACTTNDGCSNGLCEGTPVGCRPFDQCHVAGTCDPAAGCSTPTATDGTSCDDRNVCTQTDACQDGSCRGSDPVTCSARDQCHVAGTCDPLEGCSNPDIADGTACDDANVCALGDICQSGVCVSRVSFTPAGPPTVAGSYPRSPVVSDFNDDGELDVAVAQYVSSIDPEFVTVFSGDGSGGLSDVPIYSSPVTGSGSMSLASGDFNGDGRPDLAARNDNTLTILIANDEGGFTETARLRTTGVSGNPIGVSDFDQDGTLDLALPSNSDMAILLGDGEGRFLEGAAPPVDSDYGGYGPIALGDFNADGTQDIAWGQTGGAIHILLGTGDGGFSDPDSSVILVGGQLDSIAVGDFNLDGTPDLAATINATSGSVFVLLGDGSGGFAPSSDPTTTVGNIPYPITVADFNLDGKQDLAVGNFGSNNLSILLGDGSGAFGETQGSPLSVPMQPIGAVAADFNSDGKPDLVVSGPSDVGGLVAILLDDPSLAPDGTECSDGDSCTGSDSCSEGSCIPGPLLDCDDDDDCTLDSCDTSKGCLHSPDPSCGSGLDCGSARASTGTLWPPDHRMVPIGVEGIGGPGADPVTILITGIHQDEAVDSGPGRGCPDGEGLGTNQALLRAERNGKGDGRVYLVTFTASNRAGGQCSGAVLVCVPHDQGHLECGNQEANVDATGPCSAPGQAGSRPTLTRRTSVRGLRK